MKGGGAINGSFLKASLRDEISVLIYPAVDGLDGLDGVQTIFEYPGEADDRLGAGQALRHMSTETLEGGMVWLRYAVEPAPLSA